MIKRKIEEEAIGIALSYKVTLSWYLGGYCTD